MAKYRQLQTSFWRDIFVTELTPEEKFFYMYLMTNENTTQCGVYTFVLKFAEVETGYNRETLEKLLTRFIEYGKIKYCRETKELMLVNWLKYNFINSKPVLSCINKELKEVKHTEFITYLYNICKDNRLPVESIFKDIDTLSIGYTDHSPEKNLPYREEEEKEEEIEEKEEVEETQRKKAEAASGDFASSAQEGFKKIVKVFNSNIHPITPLEYEKLLDWCRDMDYEVVIAAIEEAVKHNARSMAYIERVLNNWLDKGLTTIEGVNACKRDFKSSKDKKAGSSTMTNSKAYKLFEEEED
jgi:DnaD/phage-associated family protein